MYRRLLYTTLATLLVCTPVFAQSASDQTNKFIIYKWSDGKVTHYSAIPPRVDPKEITKLDQDGLVITDPVEEARQYAAPAIRKIKFDESVPSSPRKSYGARDLAKSNQNQQLPQGTITREQRCQDAQHNLSILRGNKRPTREDANGNLVPLSDAEVQQQLSATQDLVNRLCQ